MSASTKEKCGACSGEFDTLEEVFSHDCDKVSRSRRYNRRDADLVDAHERNKRPPRGDGPPRPKVSDDALLEVAKGYLLEMDRKLSELDVTEELRRAALVWLRRLPADEDFEFLVDVRDKVVNGRAGFLSERQAKGVLNCWRARLLKERRPAPAPNSILDLSTLPEGTTFYAVPTEESDNDLAFLKVDRVVEGKWDGWVFVKHLVGDTEERIGRQKPGETYSGRNHKLVEKILDDPAEAARQYGLAIGRCGVCGRRLTNEESREYGIGPVCREATGW